MRSSDRAIVPRPGVPLAPLSTLQVGGAAQWYVRALDVEMVAAAHRWCEERQIPMWVLGGGSNVVLADRGVDGLVLHVEVGGVEYRRDGEDTVVRAGAGEPWDPFVAAIVDRGLAGLECLSGIPGLCGGTPIQNVGAYGQEVRTTIERVTALDRRDGRLIVLPAADCRFGYRASRFRHEDAGRFIICDVTFRLRPGPPTVGYPDLVAFQRDAGLASPTLADVRAAVLHVRRRKGMVLDARDPDTRSAGSFFTNPVVSAAHGERMASLAGERPPAFAAGEGRVKVPAAWLIERAGFARGFADGAAGLSGRHPLAIVNRGGATARDIVRLALRIVRTVEDRFGVRLRPEPVFVGFGDNPEVACLQGLAVSGRVGPASS